jgi:hypothetical protein
MPAQVRAEDVRGGAPRYATDRPCSRDVAEDDGDQVVGDGSGDADGHVGLMPVIGADEDAQPECGEVDGVFAAVTQGSPGQVLDDGDQPTDLPGGVF